MAVTLYMPSPEVDPETAIVYGATAFSSMEAALANAHGGWYIHTLHIDTNTVVTGKNTLGPLV